MRESTRTCTGTRFVAFLLIFCMVLQMFSISPKAVRAQEESTTAVTEEQHNPTDNITSNDTIIQESMPTVETKEDTSGSTETTPEQAQTKEREVSDITENTGLVTVALDSLYQTAKGTETIPFENKENTFDLTKAEVQKNLFFKWRIALNKGILKGDTITISLPKTEPQKADEGPKDHFIFKDTQDALALKTPDGIELGSYVIKDNTAVMTLNEAAAKVEDEPITFDVELETSINQEALKDGKTTEVVVTQQGEKADAANKLTLKLPAKTAELTPEPSPEPEVKKEESKTLDNLKGFFGVQKSENTDNFEIRNPNLTKQTDAIKLQISYLDYVAPDKTVSSYSMVKEPDGSMVIDLSKAPYEPGGRFNMGLDFDIVDIHKVYKLDFFEFNIPKELTVSDSVIGKDMELLTGQGQVIAKYRIFKNTDDSHLLKVTFTDVVENKNVSGVSGGVVLDLGLNEGREPANAPKAIDLNIQGDENGKTTITLPPVSHKVEGIEKKGVYNDADGTIEWRIKVGSKTPGASLAGVTVKDTSLTDIQSVLIGDKGVDITESFKNNGNTYTFTSPNGTDETEFRAPQEIKIVQKVADGVYKDMQPGDIKEVKNNAKIEADSKKVDWQGDKTATDSVKIKKPDITKKGVQNSGNSISWVITLNDTGDAARNNMYDAVVTDTMESALSFDDTAVNTLQIKDMDDGGQSVSVEKWVESGEPRPADNKNYYTYLPKAGGTKELKIYFYANNRWLTHKYAIEFTTQVDKSKLQEDDYTEGNIPASIKNNATLDCGWPHGKGTPGDPIHHGIGPIGTDYHAAYLTKNGTADQSTGLITWTINPSTRVDNLNAATDTAVISDVIKTDEQEYIGNVKVLDKNGQAISGDTNIKIEEPTALNNALQITISGTRIQELNDLSVQFETRAKQFYDNAYNYKDYTYTNEAKLKLTKDGKPFENTAEAQVKFPNNFLKKDTAFEKAGDDLYMKYTILVNQNGMPLNNLNVTDDFDQLKTTIKKSDGTSETKTGLTDLWEIEQNKTKIEINGVEDSAKIGANWTNNKFTYTPAAGSNKYAITLYLKLTDDAKKTYLGAGNCSITTENATQATGESSGKNLDFKVTSTGSGENGSLDNKLVNKTNIKPSTEAEPLILSWKIEINPLKAQLSDNSTTTPIAIEDTVPKGLEFVLGSFKLTKNGTPETMDQAKIELRTEADGSTTLRYPLEDKTAYELTYDTKVVDKVSGGNAKNAAKLMVGDKARSADEQQSSISRGAWGKLELLATYKFIKYDAAGGVGVPLAGATFELYRDANGTELINRYTSDKNGVVKFLGLDPGKTYYYKEISAPAGYKVDNAIKPIAIDVNSKGEISGTNVSNEREVISNSVAITKTYEDNVSNQQSTFELYLYTGTGYGGKKVPVVLIPEVSEGSYKYDSKTGTADSATPILNKKDDGSITITDLPWGQYGLIETKTADGYAIYPQKDEKHFKIDQSGAVTYEFGTNDVKNDAKINNEKTKIYVAKVGDNGNPIAGAELEIQTNGSDNKPSGTPVKDPFDTSKTYSWTSDNNKKEIIGLPGGQTYWLVERAGPNDKTVAMAQPIQFKVEPTGEITGSNTNAQTKTITMTDKTIKIKVDKKDQFGAFVEGAELEIKKQGGSNAIATWTTDKKAHEVTGLERGETYVLSEKTTPSSNNYLKANDVTFSINDYGEITIISLGDQPDQENNYKNKFDKNSRTITLTDERISGHVQFTKWDNKVNTSDPTKFTPLADVKFDLYKKGTSVTADKKINKDGEHFVSLNADIDKGKGLVTTVGSEVTNNETKEKFKNGLLPGTYYFKEVETHGDFVLPVGNAAKSEEVTIADNNRYTWQAVGANQKHFIKEINKSNQFSNTPLKTNIVVKKTDADDPSKGVIGAKYGLYYNDNGKLGDIVSGGLNNVKREIFTQEAGKDTPEWIDTNGNKYIVKVEKNGYGYFCDVKKGDFWVKEIAPAPGYILSTEQKSVSVTDASASKSISVEVTNQQNQITITKTAADTGKPLPGATLALTGKFVNKNGTQDKEATTKSWSTTDEPTKTITGLLVADEIYTLSETSPAWGYKLSDKKVTFKVKLDGTIELTDDAGVATIDDTKENIAFKNEAITAALSKTDQKGLPISDVSFEMKGSFADAPETSAVKTFTTDEKGSINLDKQIIAGQTYTLKETAAPKQYQINPSQIQITVGNDGKLTIKDPSEEVKRIAALSADGTKLTVKNDLKLGNIIFSKKAIEDEGLAETTAREGVTFGIYTDAKCTIPVSQDGKNLTAISGKDGAVSFNNLPAAIYYIKEVPQTGDVTAYYKSNPNIYTANIDGSIEDNTGGVYGITEGDSKDNTVINTAIRGDISLKKVNDEFKTIDAQGQEVTLNLPLSGAIFAVCPKDDPGSIVAAILEKDGTQGEYGLMPAKNINWESGYKVVENNAFGISYLFNNRLLAGEYNIVETTAPAGYTKPENPVAEIHIAEGATNHNSIITNITKKADIPVEKQIEVKTNNQKTEMQAAGEGFSFSLERIAEPSGDALRFHYSAKAKTEQDGKALFAQVPIGQYKVTEMAVSGLTEPYVIPEAKIVTVKEDGTVSCENAQKVSFNNYLTQIEFNKAGCISEHCSDTPDLSKPLEGAVFGIYSDPACTQKVQEAVSNGDGIVQFTGMNHGLWYVKEISAPMAYVVDPAVYIANIDEKGHFEALTKADGQKLEDNSILNEAVRGSIKLIKRDEQTGALLPNSTYGLYKKIEAQSRMLSSVSSPQLRDENTEFEQIEGYELITTAITDGKGEILFDGLLTGPEYLVKELKAPDGSKVSAIPIMLSFKLDDTGQGAVIGKADNGNGTAEINPDGTVTWKEPPVMVDIYKQDMKGKNLAGATLRITDKNGNPVEGVDDWVSTTEPHVIMGKLNGGQEYILTEVAAPSGYVMAEPVHFTVSNEPVGPGQDYHEPVYMKDDTTKVQFSKIAITGGAELPGAKLSLKDAEGNVVEEWTSGDKPHLIEGKLTAGASYTLTEITAPQGYEVAENITFKVGTDGKLQTVTMLDKPIITPGDPEKEPAKPISKGPGTGLFETGAQSSLWTMMALLALAALVVCGTVVYRRKH